MRCDEHATERESRDDTADARVRAKRERFVRDMKRIAEAAGLKVGWLSDDDRAAMPHVVEVTGLTADNLQQRFTCEYHRRRLWCEDCSNCAGRFEIEPLYDGMRQLGRRFRFARLADAALFKKRFETVL